MSNRAKFKVGEWVVRVANQSEFAYGVEPLQVVALDKDNDLLFKGDSVIGWNEDYFDLYKPEVKSAEQTTVDRKLRLTEMQKEAIQAGINALNTWIAELVDQQNSTYDPSLIYPIEICKYQQEVLRSMLREVNR